jgi:hypothetical protein
MATRQEQIDFIKRAIVPAERVAARLGVPSNAVMAQWAMESGWGTSDLSRTANNFGGIKEWKNGPSVRMPTKEEVNGKKVSTQANFKKFADINQYADEYGNFLSGDRYKNVRGQTDPAGFANALAASGYATTNPQEYSSSIMNAMKSVDRLIPEVKGAKPTTGQANTPPAGGMPGFSFQLPPKQPAKTLPEPNPNPNLAKGFVPRVHDRLDDIEDWYKKNGPNGNPSGKAPSGEDLLSSNGMGKGMDGGAIAGKALDAMGGLAKLLSSFAGAGGSKADDATNQMLDEYAQSIKKPSFSYQQPTRYRFPGFFNG